MERKNAKVKNTFTQVISQISKLYKDCSNINNEAHLIGKKEAFEEILNWFVTSHNGELKYISANSFFNMIQEKLAKTRTALANKQGDDADEDLKEIKPAMNFAEIKLSDNRKRINRYAQIENNQNFGYLNSGGNSEAVVMEEYSGIGSTGSLNNNTANNINQGQSQAFNFPFSVSSLINSENNSNSFMMNSTINTNSNQLNNISVPVTGNTTGNSINSNNFPNALNSMQTDSPFNSGSISFSNPFAGQNNINNSNTNNNSTNNIFSSNNIQQPSFLSIQPQKRKKK